MNVHLELPREPMLAACALTVGTFDGVHRGHQLLVSKVRQDAARRAIAAVVVTFQEMPYCFFQPDLCPKLLTLPDEKIEAFRATGIDHLFIVPFNAALAGHTAQEFVVDILQAQLGLQVLRCGPDFALGRDRGGTVHSLAAIGREHGFEVLPLEAKLLEGDHPISSTRAREAVESGDVVEAERLLGRSYALEGEVVSGRQLGRTIGFPTLNLQPHERKAVPARGVYAVRAFLDNGEAKPAALNIGVRPTVNGEWQTIEAYIVGETLRATPRCVRVEFVARLREERKFADLAALKSQLALDAVHAEELAGI